MKNVFNLIKILLFYVAAVMFFSCSDVLQSDNNEKVSSTGKFTVTAVPGYSGSRFAVPSALSTSFIYKASLSYSGDKIYADNSGSLDSFMFVFDAPLFETETECTLTVYAFRHLSDSDKDPIGYAEGYYRAIGSAKQNIKPGQLSCDFGEVLLTLNPKKAGNGTASLSIIEPDGLSLTLTSVTKDGNKLSEHNFNFNSSTRKLSCNGMQNGSYVITFSANDSSNNPVELENPVQIVNIFANIVTNYWIVDGVLKDALEIKKAAYTTFYVCGAAPGWYGESTINVDGNNTSGTGSLTKPLDTVGAAVAKCIEPGKNYTIYVDGTTTEQSSIEISKNISIKSLSGNVENTVLVRGESNTSSMIKVKEGARVVLEKISINGNKVSISGDDNDSGAGIKNEGNLTLNDCCIYDCYAKQGGAIALFHSGSAVMNGGEIRNNNATGDSAKGGAVYIWGDGTSSTSFVMNSGNIHNNYSNGSGGAIYIDDGSGGKSCFEMNGGTIKSNSVGTGNGKAIWHAAYIDMEDYEDKEQLKISGSAFIDRDNDIYLGLYHLVTITGPLNPADGEIVMSLTAKISLYSPEDPDDDSSYAENHKVLSGTNDLINNNYSKFQITPEITPSGTINWYLCNNGTISNL